MPKLKRFKKNQLNYKSISISLALVIGLMTVFGVYKSYAIYKLEKKYDLIQSKIGTYTMGDVRVAVLVDGKEASEFPSYETNYKVESVECTNGVTASFDVENWQINIADMSSTSTKCTVSFNSKETNEIKPVNMSKTQLLALNEEYQNVAYENLKEQLLNDTYPVGSIYMSTSDDTIEKVENKFGGTWVRYAEDTTLVGYQENTNEVNDTGGSKTVTLTTGNLPSHNHTITPAGTITSKFTGSSATTNTVDINHGHDFSANTSTTGAHAHKPYRNGYFFVMGASAGETTDGYSAGTAFNGTNKSRETTTTVDGNHYHSVSGTTGWMRENNTHNHTVTAKGSVTSTFKGTSGTTSNTGSGTAISVQDPYTVVYMYKRTA